ncbi:MFS transporter [Nocardioides plantarum]|uniref:MFS transporter n=1 Tax=Nocardioides plantarum TaxID=29299 RepID=A0ABV5KGC7_9ACTN|nr:MFS transporter [Nocardioides plantarum]
MAQTAQPRTPDHGFRTAGRTVVLATFAALVVVTQVLWLTFSPVTDEVAGDLGVGSGRIGDLTALNPLVFVVLALPAGRWLDRRLAPTLACGAALTALGATVRALGPDSFTTLLCGQIVVSLGQPLVVGATTAVAVRFAPARSRATVIALVSAAQFVGILVAALSTGPLYDAVGLDGLVRAQAVLAVAVALAVAVSVLGVAPLHDGARDGHDDVRRDAESGAGRRLDPFLVGLAVTLFVGVGVFNAVATWLDSVLDDLGEPDAAGGLIAAMTVAGILGSLVLPGWASRTGRRRQVLVGAAVVTVTCFVVAALAEDVVVLGVVLVVVGLALLPCLPIALEWAEVRLGADRAARGTTLLLLAGNAGGVVLVLTVQAFLSSPAAALGAVAVVALPAVVATLTLPRDAPVR